LTGSYHLPISFGVFRINYSFIFALHSTALTILPGIVGRFVLELREVFP